ncbi:MAG: thioredoxin family protein [Muribaculaceae bacterium]|nr:thioredoxin family protein [Muribaculaceae bacterium]
MKKLILIIAVFMTAFGSVAQERVKIYDEGINPDHQISEAIAKAGSGGKFVIAQLGGNWCKWCIRFARFIEADPEIKGLVDDNFEYIHVNYNPRNENAAVDMESTKKALRRLGNPMRFGYPVLVVLDSEGNVIHTQDSGFLESGDGYDKEKVIRFLESWTPKAVEGAKIK